MVKIDVVGTCAAIWNAGTETVRQIKFKHPPFRDDLLTSLPGDLSPWEYALGRPPSSGHGRKFGLSSPAHLFQSAGVAPSRENNAILSNHRRARRLESSFEAFHRYPTYSSPTAAPSHALCPRTRTIMTVSLFSVAVAAAIALPPPSPFPASCGLESSGLFSGRTTKTRFVTGERESWSWSLESRRIIPAAPHPPLPPSMPSFRALTPSRSFNVETGRRSDLDLIISISQASLKSATPSAGEGTLLLCSQIADYESFPQLPLIKERISFRAPERKLEGDREGERERARPSFRTSIVAPNFLLTM